MARKIVCDICGRDTDDTDYVLPAFDEIRIKGGNPEKVLFTMEVGTKTCICNLCPICAQAIASFVYELEYKMKNAGLAQ